MAKDDKDADKTGDDAAAKKAPGGSKKIILIAVAAVALVGASVGTTMLLTGSKDDVKKVAKKKAKADKDADAEEGEGDAEEGDGDEEAVGEEEVEVVAATNPDGTPKVAIYLDFDQPFIVNFVDEGQLRYLQVSVSVMTMDPKVVDLVKRHTPLIRNNLVMLFSGQTRDTIISREGKEKIRKEAEAEVQKIMKEKTGRTGIKSLYFTSFVMQ